MWFLAVGAGVAETVVGAVAAIGDGISMPALAAQLAVRTIVYGALFVIIDRYFRRGVPWSRYLLAGLLGTVGLVSLVYEPITWLADNDLTQLDWSVSFFMSSIAPHRPPERRCWPPSSSASAQTPTAGSATERTEGRSPEWETGPR